MVTVARVTTELEFQEVVTWWNLKREREIFHRWGYMGRTLDSMFPLPQEFRTRREETEAALRPYWTRGEIWVCKDRQTQIRHVITFELRPEMAVNYWCCRDWDYLFTLTPEEIPSGGLPPGAEEYQWNGAPREALRSRARLPNPFAAIADETVYADLAGRGIAGVEFREVWTTGVRRRAVIKLTPIGYDRWTRRQRYRVLVSLPELIARRQRSPNIQAALVRAEAL